MRLFLDTASIEEIREINRWGVLGGITTNPSLLAKEHQDPEAVWKEIETVIRRFEQSDGTVIVPTERLVAVGTK